MKSKSRKRAIAICQQCAGDYQRRADMPQQKFCSRRCKGDWMKAQPRRHTPQTIRRLEDHEPLPPGTPSRYMAHGYVVLRWKVGVRSYVEVLEHRFVTGRQSGEVHHINSDRSDNRPENLMPVSSTEHGAQHAKWNIDQACELYRSGWSLCDLQRHFHVGTVQVMRSLKLRGVQMRTISEAWVLRKQKERNADKPVRYQRVAGGEKTE